MDIAAILAIVTKAETVASLLIAAGQNAAPAWAAVKGLFKSKASLTQADYDAADAMLDAALDEFNLDLPAA